MWNDIETTTDYLHFSVIAKTVSDLIIESGDNPISIGVSGSWGSGKSSMVKMIGNELMNCQQEGNNQYVFLEFNAWLYQGYDDAKEALLRVVANKLSEEVKKNKGLETDKIEKKIQSFVKRINWFQLSKLAIPILMGLIPGAAPVGVIASFAGAITNSLNSKENKKENGEEINSALNEMAPEIQALLKEESSKSAPAQIEELRKNFEEILRDLNITLVVLVDDLDRCLPETAIATLEAMRLLLFVKRTAFIIAADEQMIRNGVKAHFGEVELTDGLVTSYFDKLIQVPITVPHLGIAEIKVYIVSLFLELETRRNHITEEEYNQYQKGLGNLLSKAWIEDISKEKIEAIFDSDSLKYMSEYIEMSDQLAKILVTADNIKGNPRLIKRFLNALEIRQKVVRLNGMTIDSKLIIKMLLFERCASSGAFDYLAQKASESADGTLDFIESIEDSLAAEKEYEIPNVTWKSEFIDNWLKMEPRLTKQDMRPLLYLSRNRSLSIAAYDDLSPESRKLLEALKEVKNGPILKDLVSSIRNVGEKEAELILNRIASEGRNNQWSMDTVNAALHITEAFPILGNILASILNEIPAKSRKAPIIPALADKEWAIEMLLEWKNESETPSAVKKAIEQKVKED